MWLVVLGSRSNPRGEKSASGAPNRACVMSVGARDRSVNRARRSAERCRLPAPVTANLGEM